MHQQSWENVFSITIAETSAGKKTTQCRLIYLVLSSSSSHRLSAESMEKALHLSLLKALTAGALKPATISLLWPQR